MHHDEESRVASSLRPSAGRRKMEQWDAGEMGCGKLVIELSNRVKKLGTGESIEVVARDPGASTDIPAWCRMTGHVLHEARPPFFLIEKRKE